MRTLLLASLLTLPTLARAESAPACDTSSDEIARQNYERVTGNKVTYHVDCVERAESFPGIVSVGKFAFDAGCRWSAILDLCAPDPISREKNVAARAMAAAGWGAAKDPRRGELALAWLNEPMHARIQWNEPSDWKKSGKAFSKPSTKKEGQNLVTRFWAMKETGKVPVHRLFFVEVRFDAKGVPGPTKVIDQVEIPIK